MKIYEIICKKWLLAKKIQAITLYPFIFYNGIPKSTTIKHEHVHIKQIQRLGVIKFYITYLYYSMKHGYEGNPLEIEAYIKQDD
jgi:hypothetical protein